MKMNDILRDFQPTLKGYEVGFAALCNILSGDTIPEKQFDVLEIYAAWATKHSVEGLIKHITTKDVVIVKKDGIARAVLAGK